MIRRTLLLLALMLVVHLLGPILARPLSPREEFCRFESTHYLACLK